MTASEESQRVFESLFRHRWVWVLLSLALLLVAPAAAVAKKTLKVGIPEYSPPFSFVDREPKVVRGFCVDLAKLLAGTMGARVEFYAMSDSRLITALKQGKIDLISGIMLNQEANTGFNLIETGIKVDRKFFVNDLCLTVTCYKDLPGHTIAVERGRKILDVLPGANNNIRLIEARSQQEALGMVNSGKAHVYISNCSLTTLYIIQKERFENIKDVGMPIETVPLALAVKENNPELLTEISLALGKVMENKSYDVIHQKWLGRDTRYSAWNDYVKYILGAMGLSGFVLFVLIFWNFVLKRKIQKVTGDLKRSEQKYRDLIESSPDMIHLISPKGSVKLVNRIALQHLGYTESEIYRLRLEDLIVRDQQGDAALFIKSVFENGFSNGEFVFRAKGGMKFHVEMVATTVRGFDGDEPMACCFSRDLTERKRLEEDLIQSDRLAIMGQMAAGIAHEINNPLGIILSNADYMLSNDLDTESLRESLRSIERNAIRAGRIIEDLLSFTRPKPPEKAPVNLVDLIEESMLFLKQKVKEKRITLRKEYPEEKVIFWGDENLIQQVLINLVLNSVQASREEGMITIRVDVKGKGDDRKVVLQIEDNGSGIAEEDLGRIFDPFFTSRKEKGFGLGLFTSRIIVEKHHGTLKAESMLGKGTRMTVELPGKAVT
ncbi:MAG: transporter substrate-binding domain-containing protein [Deltaproteobacteria bacterium]|nr:transporter substrate-binding domain-containing protein [Deltaproteobacteria bacterium]MBW2064319.1 transporter substrate-binding domain-containing protein [Deltaproteobacteria bacterium]